MNRKYETVKMLISRSEARKIAALLGIAGYSCFDKETALHSACKVLAEKEVRHIDERIVRRVTSHAGSRLPYHICMLESICGAEGRYSVPLSDMIKRIYEKT